MGSVTIKELREAFNDGAKKEINRFSIVSYHQGYTNALFCVKKGLSTLVGVETEPPVTVEDIVKLVGNWLDGAERELEQVKKEQEW
jgi:hypothetical protein